MSQNTMTTIYTGLDIAKLNLQLHLAGRIHDLPNTATGHRRLIKLLTTQSGIHVVCEANVLNWARSIRPTSPKPRGFGPTRPSSGISTR
jgi:hypothetical protein